MIINLKNKTIMKKNTCHIITSKINMNKYHPNNLAIKLKITSKLQKRKTLNKVLKSRKFVKVKLMILMLKQNLKQKQKKQETSWLHKSKVLVLMMQKKHQRLAQILIILVFKNLLSQIHKKFKAMSFIQSQEKMMKVNSKHHVVSGNLQLWV
jgi:hypothetical protein